MAIFKKTFNQCNPLILGRNISFCQPPQFECISLKDTPSKSSKKSSASPNGSLSILQGPVCLIVVREVYPPRLKLHETVDVFSYFLLSQRPDQAFRTWQISLKLKQQERAGRKRWIYETSVIFGTVLLAIPAGICYSHQSNKA
jgi:hypothetical protein